MIQFVRKGEIAVADGKAGERDGSKSPKKGATSQVILRGGQFITSLDIMSQSRRLTKSFVPRGRRRLTRWWWTTISSRNIGIPSPSCLPPSARWAFSSWTKKALRPAGSARGRDRSEWSAAFVCWTWTARQSMDLLACLCNLKQCFDESNNYFNEQFYFHVCETDLHDHLNPPSHQNICLS